MTTSRPPQGRPHPGDSRALAELEQLARTVLWGDAGTAGPAEMLRSQNFIRLGGDSLRAMHLAAVSLERLGVVVSVDRLLSDEPLAAVLSAARAADRPAPGAGAAQASPAEAISAAQRGMWIADRVVGGSAYHLVFLCLIRGALRTDILEKAIDLTVRRHDGLRSIFPELAGRVERHVQAPGQAPVTHLHHAGGETEFTRFARSLAGQLGQAPFDLGSAPPLRFTLLAGGADLHALITTAHHIILDGWAMGLLLQEIFAHYGALERGAAPEPEPGPQAGDLLRWQQRLRHNGEWDRQAAFWERQLDAVPTVLDIPADRPRPPFQDPRGARHPVDLGQALTQAVAGRSSELSVTPFSFFLGAFALTLSRYTGTKSLLVGTPLACRPTPGLERLVAAALNLVPVRIDVDDDVPVAAYLQQVHRSLARSIDHGMLPFEELVSRLGLGGSTERHPLVQVAFSMHDQLVPGRLRTPSLDVRIEEGHGGGSQFDLELLIRRREPSFAGDLEFATAIWRPAEAAAFAEDLCAGVRELAADAGARLADVRCISPRRKRQLETLNETSAPYPQISVQELFRRQAEATPDAPAVREGGTTLTYAELARAAAVQARLLAAAGARPGTVVLIGLDRSIAEIVAVLGTLSAGAAYAGVEQNLPQARIDQMVRLLHPAAAVVPDAMRDAIGPTPRVESWQPSWRTCAADETEQAAQDPGRPAYVGFTSGSTGVPKGVCVPHRGIVRLVHGADYVRLGPGERFLRLAPLSFDASTLEIWGALLTGAALEVCPPGLLAPGDLGAFMAAQGVTVAWLTSGLFRLISQFAPASLAGLRHVLTGGDVVPPGHVAALLTRHRGLTVTNGYGPAENTTFTTVHTVTDPGAVEDPLPIGRPVPNTRVHVLDQRHRLVPPGGIGELYIAGDGLASGYLGNEQETARRFGRFSPDVPDRLYRSGDIVRIDSRGRLQFLGRRDDQVKIRGYRIELDEIRIALTGHPGVRDALVTVSGTGSAEKRILAACVPANGSLDAGDLEEFLSARLPRYMVPGLWAVLDSMPLTPNGKIDRGALERLAQPAALRFGPNADSSGPQ